MLATAKLAGSNVVLHAGDNHGDDGERLRYAGDLGDHSHFHDLCFDLSEAGEQDSLTGPLGDQHPGRAHERIDDIAYLESELLHAPAHAGTDNGLC